MNISIPKTSSEHLIEIALTLTGGLLLILSSWIKVPCFPVPFTGHTFFIFILGLLLTPRIALTSSLIYLSVNVANLLGPTGGYILAMPIAAYFLSAYKQTISPLLALILAQALIYLLGVSHLTYFIGLKAAIFHGMIVFLPAACIKIALAYKIGRKWV
ncbi:MAG: hypothetical protein SP1CHLAM54_10080 [Chlamydiia bacterium]|nr:hypothetical protein [Chlamydiia bacterium]MCH9615914.1 hypothetical protein [Chlamydiia bacterium]MCH9628683.1 hypothetical protein [Chlamydiia bacterium]